jgi:hypothetical protein
MARTPHVSPSPPSPASMTTQDRQPVAAVPGSMPPAGRGWTPPPLCLLHLARQTRPLHLTHRGTPPPLKCVGSPLCPPFLLHYRSHTPLVVKHLFPPLLCLLSDQGHRGVATAPELKPPPPKPPLLSEPLLHHPLLARWALCHHLALEPATRYI